MFEFEVEYTLGDYPQIWFYTDVVASTKEEAINKVLNNFKDKNITVKNCMCRWRIV